MKIKTLKKTEQKSSQISPSVNSGKREQRGITKETARYSRTGEMEKRKRSKVCKKDPPTHVMELLTIKEKED